jgi:hypothetical protein
MKILCANAPKARMLGCLYRPAKSWIAVSNWEPDEDRRTKGFLKN